MPLQIQCPHCRSLCQVSEQHMGAMVNCGVCRKPFQVRGATPPPAAIVVPQSGKPAPPAMIMPQLGRPSAAPPGTYDPPSASAPDAPISIKDGLRGVFKALMPFSKVDEQSPPPMAQTVPDEDVMFEFAPAAQHALKQPAALPSGVPLQVPAGASWSAPPATGVCRLDIGGATSPGMTRKRNEDSFLIQQLCWANLDKRHELALLAVADGLGGHEAGDRASHMIVQALGAGLVPILTGALTGQVKDSSATALAPAVETALKAANQQVYRRSQTDASCRGMGATASVVLIWNGQVVIGHVGDTRVYACRGGKASQLTRDQTLVEKMVLAGQITPQQAAVHPARNEVAQAVGRQSDVDPAIYQFKMVPGDWLIIACDGLHAHVDLALLEKTIKESLPSATFLAHKLVKLTDDRGGSDNCTVIAVHCY